MLKIACHIKTHVYNFCWYVTEKPTMKISSNNKDAYAFTFCVKPLGKAKKIYKPHWFFSLGSHLNKISRSYAELYVRFLWVGFNLLWNPYQNGIEKPYVIAVVRQSQPSLEFNLLFE